MGHITMADPRWDSSATIVTVVAGIIYDPLPR